MYKAFTGTLSIPSNPLWQAHSWATAHKSAVSLTDVPLFGKSLWFWSKRVWPRLIWRLERDFTWKEKCGLLDITSCNKHTLAPASLSLSFPKSTVCFLLRQRFGSQNSLSHLNVEVPHRGSCSHIPAALLDMFKKICVSVILLLIELNLFTAALLNQK